MKLLHITTDPRTLGFVLPQMLFMRAKGWDVHAMASPGDYESALRNNSVPFHAVSMHPRIDPLSDLVSIARMCLSIGRLRPAIIHAHTLKAGLIAMIAGTVTGVPIRIFHLHGLPHLGARGFRRRLLAWSTRAACRLAHRVLCVSTSVRQVLTDENLCSPERAVVPVHGSCDGIDALHRFNPSRIPARHAEALRSGCGIPPHALTVAFIGRLVRHKGLGELGEAWKLLRAAHPDMHLLIAGDFEPQDPIPPDTLGLFRSDPRVHMVGLCTQMPELYTCVDLVVLPSYYEGLPLVLLEAAAMGLPVVASAIPGNVDAVRNHETGILFRLHDATDLALAIGRYANDPALRGRHGGAARQRVLRDFSPAPVREFIFREYTRLLALRGMDLPTPRSSGELSPSGQALVSADLP